MEPPKSFLKWQSPRIIFNKKTKSKNIVISSKFPENLHYTRVIWNCWKNHKFELKDVGLSFSKYPKETGDWSINFWHNNDNKEEFLRRFKIFIDKFDQLYSIEFNKSLDKKHTFDIDWENF